MLKSSIGWHASKKKLKKELMQTRIEWFGKKNYKVRVLDAGSIEITNNGPELATKKKWTLNLYIRL